jgi:hypothetical protein
MRFDYQSGDSAISRRVLRYIFNGSEDAFELWYGWGLWHFLGELQHLCECVSGRGAFVRLLVDEVAHTAKLDCFVSGRY